MKRYDFGNPIPTGATLIQVQSQPTSELAFVKMTDQTIVLQIELDENAAVYGLGQNLGGINKYGRQYTSYCTDDPHHTEDKGALYAAHNLLFFKSKEGGDLWRGLYIDCPSRIDYDIAFSDHKVLKILVASRHASVYLSSDASLENLASQFRSLFGRPYLPPKWAFGYFQSRWGYKSEEDLLEVQGQFKAHQIPLEGIYVDIDYMERFKDFTIDQDQYPDFKGLVDNFKKANQYLVPIIDAGVKIEPGYAVYEEGITGDHFVKDEGGKPYVAAVWPGRVHFPDFFRPQTRQWFGDWYKFLIDLGIKGIWNDMNEPAIFYDDTALQAAIDKAIASQGQNLDIYSYFELGDHFRNLSNKLDYYKTMQHEYLGNQYSNHEVHNLYGFFMTQSAFEGFQKHMPDERPLILSRASHIGMHRYGGIWTGDNSSWWSHLAMNVKQMPSLSMVGFLYAGADTGGFGGNASPELLTRWLQFSIFTPLLRNHAALGTRMQEPYQFGQPFTDYNKELIKIRYRLLPFIYSEFLKAYHHQGLLFKPLSFVYDDGRCVDIEDQLMLGSGVMVAPVIQANQRGRSVYLPEPMTCVTIDQSGVQAVDLAAGDHYIQYGLHEVKLFLRPGYLLPLVEAAMQTASINCEKVTWVGSMNLCKNLVYSWLDDDGQSYSCLEQGPSTVDYTLKIDTNLRGYTLEESATSKSPSSNRNSWRPNATSQHHFCGILK